VSETTITIYTRENCHLCKEAIETIRRVSTSIQRDVTITVVDVDVDPELWAEYGDRVPYVFVDGRPAFKYRIDETALRRRLTP
jgi:glutaredoxin